MTDLLPPPAAAGAVEHWSRTAYRDHDLLRLTQLRVSGLTVATWLEVDDSGTLYLREAAADDTGSLLWDEVIKLPTLQELTLGIDHIARRVGQPRSTAQR